MPRYYFNLWYRRSWAADETGAELPDDAAAAAYGHGVAQELARNNEHGARTGCITVCDAGRRKLLTIPLGSLDQILGEFPPATPQTLQASYARQRDLQ